MAETQLNGNSSGTLYNRERAYITDTLRSQYQEGLQHDFNSTRLKEKLMADISELDTHKQEGDGIIVFDEDIALALSHLL